MPNSKNHNTVTYNIYYLLGVGVFMFEKGVSIFLSEIQCKT